MAQQNAGKAPPLTEPALRGIQGPTMQVEDARTAFNGLLPPAWRPEFVDRRPNLREQLAWLWKPNTTGDPALKAFLRASLVTSAIGATAPFLAVAFFIASFFVHSPALAAVGFALLALAMGAYAVRLAVRIRLVLHLGHWTGWSGQRIGRHEHPRHFWSGTALHGILVTAYAAAAVALIWQIPGLLAVAPG